MTPFSRIPGLLLLALTTALPLPASALPMENGEIGTTSSLYPLPPVYAIHEDNSVTLRLCYNWSCATRETVFFSAKEMAGVKEEMAVCSGDSLHDRLQRLRIGVWQMEALAERFQPLLANDTAINDQDQDLVGRMDCIDNSTNTTTYLNILRDVGQIPDWSISAPEVRDRFLFELVHWTAVVTDQKDGRPWSIDAWYRPNGHLPFVMTLADWTQKKLGWNPPLDNLNPYPHHSRQLCSVGQDRLVPQVADNQASRHLAREDAN